MHLSPAQGGGLQELPQALGKRPGGDGGKGGTTVAGSADKGVIIGYSEQIQLTNMPAGGVLRQSQWSSEAEPRSSIGEHICQLDLRGMPITGLCHLVLKRYTIYELEGHSNAYNWIICAGQLNTEC